MDKPECDSAYERLLAMLTACAQGAVLSAGPVPSRVQSLDFMVKGFAAELAAESLSNQLDQIAQDVAALKSDLELDVGTGRNGVVAAPDGNGPAEQVDNDA